MLKAKLPETAKESLYMRVNRSGNPRFNLTKSEFDGLIAFRGKTLQYTIDEKVKSNVDPSRYTYVKGDLSCYGLFLYAVIGLPQIVVVNKIEAETSEPFSIQRLSQAISRWVSYKQDYDQALKRLSD